MSGFTYDAGALIAAERSVRHLWALHRRLIQSGVRPTLPAVVLGQVWRGGPQVQLSRLVRSCRVVPFTEADARAVGKVLGASATSDLVDAAVVVTAAARGETIVTSDPEDLRRIASAAGLKPSLHAV